MLRLASRRNSRLWLTQFAKWLPQHGGCAGPRAPGLAAHPQPPLRAAGRDRHRHSL